MYDIGEDKEQQQQQQQRRRRHYKDKNMRKVGMFIIVNNTITTTQTFRWHMIATTTYGDHAWIGWWYEENQNQSYKEQTFNNNKIKGYKEEENKTYRWSEY